MNFYSTLARRNIIFSKQEKLAFKELLVCETHSVNGAVDNVNQVNWLDCDFIYENKKLYLVTKNSPFIEKLSTDILLFNKLLLNQADGGAMTTIKKPFTFSVDLEEIYYNTNHHKQFFSFNGLNYGYLMDPNRMTHSSTPDWARQFSPISQASNRSPVNPIQSLLDSQNRARSDNNLPQRGTFVRPRGNFVSRVIQNNRGRGEGWHHFGSSSSSRSSNSPNHRGGNGRLHGRRGSNRGANYGQERRSNSERILLPQVHSSRSDMELDPPPPSPQGPQNEGQHTSPQGQQNEGQHTSPQGQDEGQNTSPQGQNEGQHSSQQSAGQRNPREFMDQLNSHVDSMVNSMTGFIREHGEADTPEIEREIHSIIANNQGYQLRPRPTRRNSLSY